MASIIHIAKLVVYAIMGFSFLTHWRIILMMIIFATLGSWAGVKLRGIIPVEWLRTILPWSLTIISLKIITDTIIKLGWIAVP